LPGDVSHRIPSEGGNPEHPTGSFRYRGSDGFLERLELVFLGQRGRIFPFLNILKEIENRSLRCLYSEGNVLPIGSSPIDSHELRGGRRGTIDLHRKLLGRGNGKVVLRIILNLYTIQYSFFRKGIESQGTFHSGRKGIYLSGGEVPCGNLIP